MSKKIRRVCIPLFGIQTRLLPSGTARAGFTIYTAFTVCGGGYYLVLSSSAGKVVYVSFLPAKVTNLWQTTKYMRAKVQFLQILKEKLQILQLCARKHDCQPPICVNFA